MQSQPLTNDELMRNMALTDRKVNALSKRVDGLYEIVENLVSSLQEQLKFYDSEFLKIRTKTMGKRQTYTPSKKYKYD